uniref:Proline rich 27 n=1 Tax=Canis lupus familiaris TaxID=9615 RepID=A0A8P0NSY1_CANLF
MKLLLWACILCAVLAKKRFHFLGEDYSGNHYPVSPSLTIPYPISDIDFVPPFRPSKKKAPNYLGNPDPDTGTPPYSWVLPSPGAPLYRIPSFPLTTWLSPSPQKPSHFVPPASRMEGPFSTFNAPMPMPAEPYVATPRTTPTTSPPNPKLIAVEPGPIEPDEAEPAAAEPQPSTSPDKVGCLNLTPIMHGICRREKETESPHKQTNIILNIL